VRPKQLNEFQRVKSASVRELNDMYNLASCKESSSNSQKARESRLWIRQCTTQAVQPRGQGCLFFSPSRCVLKQHEPYQLYIVDRLHYHLSSFLPLLIHLVPSPNIKQQKAHYLIPLHILTSQRICSHARHLVGRIKKALPILVMSVASVPS
jgi:hypothetical protein